MNEGEPNELEFVQTDALIEELVRRFDAGTIHLVNDINMKYERTRRRWWGGSRAVGISLIGHRQLVREYESERRDDTDPDMISGESDGIED